MTATGSAIVHAGGPALVLPGDDIDTDRIMPARFLKAITFAGLETHLFEDDRLEAAARGLTHAFDRPAAREARILVVGANFGCGSSREHAPQAIARWGFRGVVGESFAEIFFGNAVMIGLPCLAIDRAAHASLVAALTADPALDVQLDVAAKTVTAGNWATPATMPESARHALISGAWDATGMLLADYEDVRKTAAGLPYLTGFQH